MTPLGFKLHRFPAFVSRRSIGSYARFTPSPRDLGEPLAERGPYAFYETVRRWFLNPGCILAANLGRNRPKPSNHWRPGEAGAVIRPRRFWHRNSVDNECEDPGFFIQRKRNAKAAGILMKKLLAKKGFAPWQPVTDKLRSYRSAFRAIGLVAGHDRDPSAGNSADSVQLPPRGDRNRQIFKSLAVAQHFLSVTSATRITSCHPRRVLKRSICKELRAVSFGVRQSAGAAA